VKNILLVDLHYQKSYEGFEKDFGIRGVQAWGMTETSPLGTVSDYSHSTIIYQKMKIRYSCQTGTAFPGVELNCNR
jgi:fatty-acyl-CoA synthase